MATLRIEKVNTLPEILQENTLYLLKNNNHIEIHITDNTGAEIYNATGEEPLSPFLFMGVN